MGYSYSWEYVPNWQNSEQSNADDESCPASLTDTRISYSYPASQLRISNRQTNPR
jgi:hypothetical protein